jgi:hypothetical protein
MVETEAQASRSMRAKSSPPRDWQFKKGNPGKKKGTRDVRTVVGIEVTRALAGRAANRLAALVDSRSPRIAFEASRLVLAYAWGAPRQTLELSGGFGDLARELTAALVEARERRLALIPSQGVSVDNTLDVKALPEGDSSLCLERATEPPEGTTPEAMPSAAPEDDRVTGEDVGEAPGKVNE